MDMEVSYNGGTPLSSNIWMIGKIGWIINEMSFGDVPCCLRENHSYMDNTVGI
jgi:hypothetical protein